MRWGKLSHLSPLLKRRGMDNTSSFFQIYLLGVPLAALGSGCCGVRGAPSRLRRDRPFGAPSASLTQGAPKAPLTNERRAPFR